VATRPLCTAGVVLQTSPLRWKQLLNQTGSATSDDGRSSSTPSDKSDSADSGRTTPMQPVLADSDADVVMQQGDNDARHEQQSPPFSLACRPVCTASARLRTFQRACPGKWQPLSEQSGATSNGGSKLTSSTPVDNAGSPDPGPRTPAQVVPLNYGATGQTLQGDGCASPAAQICAEMKCPGRPVCASLPPGISKEGTSPSLCVMDEVGTGLMDAASLSRGRSGSKCVTDGDIASVLGAASASTDGSRSRGLLGSAEEDSMGNAVAGQQPQSSSEEGSGGTQAGSMRQEQERIWEKRKAAALGSYRLASKVPRHSEGQKVCSLVRWCLRMRVQHLEEQWCSVACGGDISYHTPDGIGQNLLQEVDRSKMVEDGVGWGGGALNGGASLTCKDTPGNGLLCVDL
jgi:hypothetical protein